MHSPRELQVATLESVIYLQLKSESKILHPLNNVVRQTKQDCQVNFFFYFNQTT